jgi:hypothetical protein
VDWLKQFFRWSVIGIVSTVVIGAPCRQAAAADFTDVTISTGVQLKERYFEIAKNQNVSGAFQFFNLIASSAPLPKPSQISPRFEDLSEVKFRIAGTPDRFDLFFIPVDISPPQKDVPANMFKPVIVFAEGPHGNKAFVGSIMQQNNRPPEVINEATISGGKPQASDQLRKFILCSTGQCLPAGLGCLRGGPLWAECFCLWCGGGMMGCALNLLF